MAAKSDGVLKMQKSTVAFTPLQNSELSGSVPGLHPGGGLEPGGLPDGDLLNGESRCSGSGGGGSRCLRSGREPQQYSVWDCLWVALAVAVYAADVGTDVWLSADYYLRREFWWFGLTLFFAVLGSFSVQLFSFRWFVHDFSADCCAEAAADCGGLADGKKLLSGSTSQQQHLASPQSQRQESAVGRSAAAAAAASSSASGGGGGGGAPSGSGRRRAYSLCVWVAQSIIHILQLGQIWR